VLTSQAQVQVDSLETLSDGTIIVKVGGKTYRGLQAPQMRDILKLESDYKLTKAHLEETERMFTQYKGLMVTKLAAIDADHKIDITTETKKATFWQTEYDKEKALRLKYQGIVDGCSGKIIFFRICI
jgi:paraquat-inducible protein B